MGQEQEQERRTAATTTTTDQTSEKTGKRTLSDDGAKTDAKPGAKPDETTDKEARLVTLIKQLEKQFVRAPAQAKQTAVTMSIEYPDRFDAAWVIQVMADIDAAAWRKQKVDVVNSAWDDRPGTAKAAIAELRARYKGDKALLRWASAMERQIDQHQLRLRLEGEVHAWDRRPGAAQAAARDLNRMWPRQYPKSWLVKFEQQVWTFQDVKWAERISPAELTAALGDNIVDWDDAPLEVKQELQIRLGRKKADQYYGGGGSGATDTRALVLSDASRTEVLDKSAQVAPKDSSFTGFTKKEDIPLKRLELTGKQYDKKSDELLGSQIKTEPTSTNPLLAQRPDVLTTLYNDVMVKQAQQYRERGQAYRTLVARIKSGETTLAGERQKMKNDLQSIDNELREQYPQLRAYEKQAKDDPSITSKLNETRQAIQNLEEYEKVINQVLAEPDGVLPNAGAVAIALPGRSMGPSSKETADASRRVAEVTDAVESVTGGPNPTGIAKNFQEMAIGLIRLQGRFEMFNAGVLRMVGNLGSYVLPESLSSSIIGMAEQSRAMGLAFTQANTKFTKDNEAIAMKYTAAGGTIPMIDRVFSTQKIFEKPDVAILAMLQVMPQTKGISLAVQVGINFAQTIEAFFSTYGRTGQLGPSFQAAGWSALQGAAGLALEKLGLPPSAALIGNITMVYGFGKARGLSNEQIEEEIAFALVGAAVGAATGAMKPGGSATLEGVAAKSRAIVATLEEGSGAKPLKTEDKPTTELGADDAVKSQRVDAAANDLAATLEQSRTLMRELQALQQKNAPTKTTIEQLKKTVAETTQKREALKSAMAVTTGRTVGTTRITTSTTDAAVTPVVETVAPKTDAVAAKVEPAVTAERTVATTLPPDVILPSWLPKENAAILKAALEAGPNVWTETGNKATGDRTFQRGLTGDFTKGPTAGVKEAQALFSGAVDPMNRSVTLYGEGTGYKTSDQATTDVTSQYASPMAVRGRVAGSGLKDVGDTTARADNLSMSNVEQISFMPDPNPKNAIGWARGFIELTRSSGLALDPKTRGAKFLAELEDTMATKAKYGEDDGYGRPLLNESELEAALTEVFLKYKK